MAGHKKKEGSFYIARCGVDPPEELQRMVFPFLEGAEAQIRDSEQAHPTAAGFLRMLRDMRPIILQDAAEMLLCGREHPVFLMPAFKSPLFRPFMDQVQAAVSAESPLEGLIDRAMPEVAEKLQSLQNGIGQDFRGVLQGQQELKELISQAPTLAHLQGGL
jgi:hypothetical protein